MLLPGVLTRAKAPLGRITEPMLAGLDLKLQRGPATTPIELALTTGAVTVRGQYLPTEALTLHPTKPVELGLVTLGRHTALAFVGTSDDRLQLVALDLDGYRPAAALSANLRCEQTTMSWGGRNFDDQPAEAGVPIELVATKCLSCSLSICTSFVSSSTFCSSSAMR